MSHQPNRLYEFGSYRLETAERLLLRKDKVVLLQPKVFDLLLVLVEHHGHLLEKDELMKLVWPNTVVEEANLANNISILRKTLDENGERYIETVPRRGYRFVAAVREVATLAAKVEAHPLPGNALPHKEITAVPEPKHLLNRVQGHKLSVVFVLTVFI